MNKKLQIFRTGILLCLLSLGAKTNLLGQNISPLATVTASNCSTGPCSAFNDLALGTCGTQLVWVSTATPPSATPGVNWIQWDWPSVESFDEITIHHASSTVRFLTGGLIQIWDGTAWVNHHTFTNLPMQCINTITFPVATASRMRITSFQMTGTGQRSNPNFREIEIERAIMGPNNAGATRVLSPDSNICAGTYPIRANVKNFGINTINNVQVNWALNNVVQTPVMVNTPLFSMGNPGINDVDVVLGNATITNTTVVKVWTSMPNNVPDTLTYNDTTSITYVPKVYTIDLPSDTVCVGSDVELSIDPSPGAAATNWAWFSGLTNYTAINGANASSYEHLGFSGNINYYSQFTTNGVVCITDTAFLYAVNPMLISVSDSSRCDPGTLDLKAEGNVGSIVNWYEDALSSTPLHTGPTFTTPYINQTTTFWAAAEVAGGYKADSIMYPLASASTSGVGHIMFTMQAMETVWIRTLSVKVSNAVNSNIAFDVYYRPDNYNQVPGANTSNVGWTLLSTRTNLVSAGGSAYTLIADNLSLRIPSGDTYSFYVVPVVGSHQYNSLANNTIAVTNADFTMRAGHRGSNLFNITSTGGVPAAKFTYDVGDICQSVREPVVATIAGADMHVNLGRDINTCIDSGSSYFLNAMNAGSNYLWDNNYNGQVRTITQSGTYWVEVTNAIGCTVADTISVDLKNNPYVDLGDDIMGCENEMILLDTRDRGIQRFWNTGQTSKQINVDRSGTYSVIVTGDNGCVKADSITVILHGSLPINNNIRVRNLTPFTFSFEQIDPSNTQSYRWDFGDGTYSYSPSPTHTYARVGNYVVLLNATSACGGIKDSATIHITPTSINTPTLNGAPVNIYPNPSSSAVTVSIDGHITINTIQVLDIQGRIIKVIDQVNSNTSKIDVSNLTNGIYLLQINTDEGNAKAKIEVLR